MGSPSMDHDNAATVFSNEYDLGEQLNTDTAYVALIKTSFSTRRYEIQPECIHNDQIIDLLPLQILESYSTFNEP